MMLLRSPVSGSRAIGCDPSRNTLKKVMVDFCLRHDGFVEGRLVCDSTV